MMNTKPNLTEIFDSVLNVLVFIAGLCLTFIVVSVCIDVIIRDLLNRPIQWVFEVAEYLLLAITFFGAAWCLREEGHVEMDILTSKLPNRVQYFLRFITSILGILICGVLTYYSAVCSWDFYKRGLYYPTLLEVPKALIIAILVVGFFLLVVQFIRRTRKYFSLWKEYLPEEEESTWLDRMH